MRFEMGSRLLRPGCCGIVLGMGAGAAAGQDGLPPVPNYTARMVTGSIAVDGVLDEPDWRRADPIPLAWEFLPGDNTAPRVETTCRVMYDPAHLYVSCQAEDPRPHEIRAHYADRDDRSRIPLDDHVIFLVDPFNDERRGFQFRVNAAGVQMDAVLVRTEGFEDFSWDTTWQSAARVTETGYDVEVAIPFSSLQFPVADGVQTWGFIFERSYPRDLRYRMRSSAMDRDRTCILCRANKITGFRDVAPGGTVEIVPTVTAMTSASRMPFPGGDYQTTTPTDLANVDPDVGLDVRWGITPSLTANGMYNPDFSQVEADVAQLSVNRRFALFFPEQRPFFLEGADYFLTPLSAVFTRTMADPDGGVKLTGKTGPDAIGVVAVRDAATQLLIPANQGSESGALAQESYTGVGRYRRDVGGGSYVGALYTGRGGVAYANHVYGGDAFYQASRSNTLRIQYLRSTTRYPAAFATAFGQHAGTFNGGALSAQATHASRSWLAHASYTDLGPAFRADAGFIPRVDVRTVTGALGRTFWGASGGWYTRIQTAVSYSRTVDSDGDMTDQAVRFTTSYQGPAQSSVRVAGARLAMVVQGVRHDLSRVEPSFEVRPSGSVTIGSVVRVGDFVDFRNNRRSFGMSLTPYGRFNLGRRLAFNTSHVVQRLHHHGQKVFSAHLTQGRLVYHFNVRALVRGVVQYRIVHRDQTQYASSVSARSEQLLTQLLFQYRVDPRTAVFAGYSDHHVGDETFRLERRDRTVFLKFGYGWRP